MDGFYKTASLVLAVILFVLSCFTAYTAYRVATAERESTTLRMDLTSKMQSIELLTNAVDSADKELERLRLMNQKMAAIQSEYERNVKGINEHNADQISNVSKLEQSTDETVNYWAAADLPADVISVLKHKPSQNSSANQDGNTVAAREPTFNGLQTTAF
jgi:hypothetical protein